jgi:hypothetical protein
VPCSARKIVHKQLTTHDVEIQHLRDLLGHASTRMTERYSHATPTRLHAAMDEVSLAVSGAEDAPPRDPATDPAVPETRSQAQNA